VSADPPCVVAADIGGTTTRIAVVQSQTILARVSLPTVRGQGLADFVVRAINELLTRSNLAIDSVAGVGVSIPGPLDRGRRQVAFTGNVGLRDYPLADRLERSLGVPVVMDDDANCAALAEAMRGAAAKSSVAVLVVVGTGIGAGIVLDGVPYRGAHSAAGEVGHVVLERNGPTCSCGHAGCFEALASGPALARRGRSAMLAGSAAILSSLVGGDPAAVDATRTLEAARRGDPGALAAVEETGCYLGLGVAAVANMFDPDVIVLGGGLGSTEAMLAAARRGVHEHCIAPTDQQVRVEIAQLGSDAGLWGAALLAAAREG
jgi:glucokinase